MSNVSQFNRFKNQIADKNIKPRIIYTTNCLKKNKDSSRIRFNSVYYLYKYDLT